MIGNRQVVGVDGVVRTEVPTAQEKADFDVKEQAHSDDTVKRIARRDIKILEAQVTPRRIREAIADPTWVNAQEALIAIERAKL